MIEEMNTTISEIVAHDYRTAAVFEKYGIDFCCGGGRSLEDACRSKRIDPAAVRSDLARLASTGTSDAADESAIALDTLIEHIVATHHRYVREAIPRLRGHLEKVARVHGERHPETVKVAERFAHLAGELLAHMGKEEGVLFPYIVRLARAARTGEKPPASFFGTVGNPIRMMEHEHRAAGDEMAELRELTGGYTTPEDACMTYRVAYSELHEFERDLHRHVHLENNILFPRAIQLESDLTAQYREPAAEDMAVPSAGSDAAAHCDTATCCTLHGSGH